MRFVRAISVRLIADDFDIRLYWLALKRRQTATSVTGLTISGELSDGNPGGTERNAVLMSADGADGLLRTASMDCPDILTVLLVEAKL